MKLKCYYAHTMTSYGSTIEAQDIAMLEGLGFKVINPNQPQHQAGCEAYVKKFGSNKIMEYFTNIVKDCDIIAFRALPEGRILSGVSAEVKAAKENDIPIIELPTSLEKRYMEYPETKQYLIELGFYKVIV